MNNAIRIRFDFSAVTKPSVHEPFVDANNDVFLPNGKRRSFVGQLQTVIALGTAFIRASRLFLKSPPIKQIESDEHFCSMSTERSKESKYKLVFYIQDRATGAKLSGDMPTEMGNMFQMTIEFPPNGYEHVPAEHLAEWMDNHCGAFGHTAGKQITRILKSQIRKDSAT